MSQTKERLGFTSAIGLLAATLGSAVGLGNIWKFPYLTGEYGGASFILAYVLSTFLVGLPILMAEIAIGRRAHSNAVGTFRKLSPNKPWWLVGVAASIAAIVVLGYYTDVVGWILAYTFKSLTGSLSVGDPKAGAAVFTALISDPWQVVLWQWGVIVFVCTLIAFGVRKGIEKTTKALLTLLFLMLLVVCARSLSLPGAAEGLAFLFTPDLSKLTSEVLLMALGLAFFKLSLGMGIMITYGGYYREDANIVTTSLRVMFADLFVSILAGIAIFPAVFSFGFEPASGAGLLFFTMPAVFNAMPAGQVFMVIFFVLASVATVGAMLSLLEVSVSFLVDSTHFSRKTCSILMGIFFVLFGMPPALSNSCMADFTLFGMNAFDFYDYLSANILMPSCGFFTSIYVGWVLGPKFFKEELSNKGVLKMDTTISLITIFLRYISPVLILVIMLKGLGIF